MSGGLGLVAMDDLGRDPAFVEGLVDLIGPMLGSGEDDDPAEGPILKNGP